MKTTLRVLIIEDSEDDALLLAREIKKNNYDVTFRRVDTSDAMSEALNQQKWDIIISDYNMPHFSVSEALELLRNSGLDLPFIIVSGVIGEEAAVDSLKAGAHDFIMKSNFSRFIPAIKRELNEAEVRRSKRIAEKKLKHLNLVLRAIRSVNQLIIREKDRDRLLKSTCENLIENREYYNAWIILLDESGEFLRHAEAGLGKDFLPMVAQLKRGELPTCCLQALRQEGVVSIKDPSSTYSDCPLANKFLCRGALIVRLKSYEKVYGLLVTSVPIEFVDDEEEKSLFQEVAGDIAFALYSIELEEKRKWAEDSLRESEERFRKFFENEPEYCYMISPEGTIIDINASVLKVLGYDKNEIIGKPLLTTIYAPSSREKAKRLFIKWKKTGKLRNEELNIITKDGLERTILLSADVVKDANGEIVHSISVQRDITERKQAEEALQEKEEFNYALFQYNPVETIVVDRGGRVIRSNMAKREAGDRLPNIGDVMYKDYAGKHETDMHAELMECIRASKMKKFPELKYGDKFLSVTIAPFPKGAIVASQDITERKRAEEELRESEEKYRTLVENVGEGVGVVDLDERFIFVNPMVGQLFGLPSEELIGRSLEEFMDPDQIEIIRKQTEIRDKGRQTQYELRIRQPDGDERYLFVTARPQFDSNGNLINVLGIFHDITERKRAEQELSKERTLLKAIIDKIPVLLTRYDPDTNMLYLNKEFEKIVGWKTEEVKDIDLMEKVYPDPDYRKQAMEYMQEASTEWREFRVQSKSGKIINSEWSNIRLDDGTQIGIGIDITERKQAEEELKAAQEYASNLIESSLDMIISVDKDRRIVEFNRAAQIAFGYHKDEVLGKHVDILYADPEEGLKAHNTARRTGRFTGEIMSKRKNGKLFPSLLSASILLEINGEFQGVMGVSRDITELKSLEQRQRELEFELLKEHRLSSIGLLASGVAHNINNPLSIILGRAQMLNRKLPIFKEFDIIIAQAKRIETIVNNMMLKSRREQETHKGPLDLNDLLTTELGFLEADMEFKHQVEKDYQFQEGLPKIEGVYSDFSQGLLNIVRNAIDAMYELKEKKLTVRTRSDKDFAYVDISDTGCGIAEDDIPKLFSPFFSTKPTEVDVESYQPRGTGLGLYSTYQLLQSYGVKFDVKSEVGKGTTFTVKIPQTSEQ